MKHLSIIGILLSSSVVSAQDLFLENLYPAELVLQNSFVISLTDQQEDKIKNIHNLHSSVIRKIQWDLDEANVNLNALLGDDTLNPDAISRQWEIVLGLENSLKKQQILTLVDLKNELNETQQEELQELKTVSNFEEFANTKSMVIGPTTIVNGTSTKTATASNTNVKLRFPADSGKNPLALISTKEGMVQIDDFDKINPEDIQSLEVLKDKWFIDKYGEKAKNGLIIITLKE